MSSEVTAEKADGARWLEILAFATVYLVWGSTYLAIKYAVQTIPPFLMGGSRFFVSGVILFGITWLCGGRPTREHWKSSAVLGVLLLLIGNGFVTYAEKTVPSGLTALIISTVPVWLILMEWLRPGGTRPRGTTIAGIALGLSGIAFLVSARDHHGQTAVNWGDALILVGATLGWARGTIYGRHAAKPASIVQFAGMQMLWGGTFMLLVGVIRGEANHFSILEVSRVSFLAWSYLTVVGGLIAFTAYAYLVKVSTPARIGTNAYVNPLIAVVLGSWIGRERLSESIVVAGAAIICAVVLMSLGGGKPKETLPMGREAEA